MHHRWCQAGACSFRIFARPMAESSFEAGRPRCAGAHSAVCAPRTSTLTLIAEIAMKPRGNGGSRGHAVPMWLGIVTGVAIVYVLALARRKRRSTVSPAELSYDRDVV